MTSEDKLHNSDADGKSAGSKDSRAGSQQAHQRRLLADRIDEVLPQLQCGRCGYAGCRPYAQAIAAGDASCDLCAPGGEATACQLRVLAGAAEHPAAASFEMPHPQVAVVDERDCVGCIKCIEACPVDAIVGSRGQTHTVLADWCTGCGLCVQPCPTDCIRMDDAGAESLMARLQGGLEGRPEAAALAGQLRGRHQAKKRRPPLRNPVGEGELSAAELAAVAMRRARRRRAASTK